MPTLDEKVVLDLTDRLRCFLKDLGGYGEPKFLTSGGSAAVFKVEGEHGLRAFKAFNPVFFNGPGGAADRRRLEVQRRFIGHTCPSLVQTYRVVEAQETAFMEMEFIPWPPLTEQLSIVPDEAVAPLFTQLVDAVKFLDARNTVHRDIKPENIHISPNFECLKLLDLGVAREFESSEDGDAAITDNGNLRPFLATAQYSSPEYLFRLDAPSSRLWKGLNFYQLGAVLHDLIMKKPIFQDEMRLGNRWLVARAVLTKMPLFDDGSPGRLPKLKALAMRCLVKDLDARLQLVDWEDFLVEGTKEPLSALRARLTKGRASPSGHLVEAVSSRLDFDRTEFVRRFTEQVRTELLPSCGTSLPLTVKPSAPGERPCVRFLFTLDKQVAIECVLRFEWQGQLYVRTVNILLEARILCSGHKDATNSPFAKIVATATISENETELATGTASAIANVIAVALDLVEGVSDLGTLHSIDLQSDLNRGGGK